MFRIIVFFFFIIVSKQLLNICAEQKKNNYIYYCVNKIASDQSSSSVKRQITHWRIFLTRGIFACAQRNNAEEFARNASRIVLDFPTHTRAVWRYSGLSCRFMPDGHGFCSARASRTRIYIPTCAWRQSAVCCGDLAYFSLNFSKEREREGITKKKSIICCKNNKNFTSLTKICISRALFRVKRACILLQYV